MSDNFKPPWHPISKQVSSSMPVQEILSTASADYEVVLSPVQVENLTTGKFTTVPNRYVIGRFDHTSGYMDNWEVVKGRYEIIPNSVIVRKAVSLESPHESISLDRAGILDNGRKFFVTLNCTDSTVNNDPFKNYIVVMTSHDGSSPISYSFVSVRVITGTTYRLDLPVDAHVKKKHTPSNESKIEDVLEEAESVIKAYNEWKSAWSEKMAEYLNCQLSDNDSHAILDKMWPESEADTARKQKHREEVIDTVRKLQRAEYNRERLDNSSLSLLSAIFDYYDNYRNIEDSSLIQHSIEIDNYTYRQKIKASKIVNEYIQKGKV